MKNNEINKLKNGGYDYEKYKDLRSKIKKRLAKDFNIDEKLL